MNGERVAKIMARRGLCSRREAEALIAAGQVVVDGVPVTQQGTRSALDARIEILAPGAASLAARVTVVLNKPAGVVSVNPVRGQMAAVELIRAETLTGELPPAALQRIVAGRQRLAVAGRLDRESRGLLVLTEDGVLARTITGGHTWRKVYVVRTAQPASESQLRKLRGPIDLDGKLLLPMEVRHTRSGALRFVLVEGRNRQIRRVCRRVGLDITDLVRVAVGPYRLDRLPEGAWRPVVPRQNPSRTNSRISR